MNINDMIMVNNIPHKQRINIESIQVSFNANNGVENEWLFISCLLKSVGYWRKFDESIAELEDDIVRVS